jgi:heterodisulfide reductase subunit C
MCTNKPPPLDAKFKGHKFLKVTNEGLLNSSPAPESFWKFVTVYNCTHRLDRHPS